MHQAAGTAALVFRVESGGQAFGTMIVQGGVATAWTASDSLQDALTAVAMHWLTDRNPRPRDEVTFRLVTGLLAAGAVSGPDAAAGPSRA
jgi:hypothetical protein